MKKTHPLIRGWKRMKVMQCNTMYAMYAMQYNIVYNVITVTV